MSIIPETILSYLPANKKHTPSGWWSFNAVCCDDNRKRGGFIVNDGDAISYHCFNCSFKASWQPGRPLSKGMKRLLRDLNVNDSVIVKLSFEAIKLLDEYTSTNSISIIPKFDYRSLPLGSEKIADITEIPDTLVPVLEYMNKRALYLEDYDFYWTPQSPNRLIIPYYYQNKLVGYTARATDDSKPKYLAEQQPGYVFNLDNQRDERKFVIVCEGQIDAISIDGCAILGSEIKESQNFLLQQLHKEIVLVPDRDHEGPKTVEAALEYGWAVSLPDWPDGIKDVNDAVVKLGRLTTLWMIAQARQSYALKTRIKAKHWFNHP